LIGLALKSIRVLICRPEPSASELANVLSAVGAECKCLPTLEVTRLELSGSDRQKIINLDQYKHIIVVSQHAGQYASELIDNYWPQAPIGQNWFAIGRKTVESLSSMEIQLQSPSGDLNSEELLKHTLLQSVNNERILLIKGREGRTKIQGVLSQRGACVETVELYQRKASVYETDHIKNQLSLFKPDYIVALSGETLENLISLGKQANIPLNDYRFILPSTRVANIAFENELKFTHVVNNLMPIDIIKAISRAEAQKTSK